MFVKLSFGVGDPLILLLTVAPAIRKGPKHITFRRVAACHLDGRSFLALGGGGGMVLSSSTSGSEKALRDLGIALFKILSERKKLGKYY